MRIPHARSIGPFSSSTPRSASEAQTASASSTQTVSWNRDPAAAPATTPGSISSPAASVLSRLTIVLSNRNATESPSSKIGARPKTSS